MTTMNEKCELNETNAFVVNLFCISNFTSKLLIAFPNVQNKEKEYLSLAYFMSIDPSNKTPPYTHISSYAIWRIHPWGCWVEFYCKIAYFSLLLNINYQKKLQGFAKVALFTNFGNYERHIKCIWKIQWERIPKISGFRFKNDWRLW